MVSSIAEHNFLDHLIEPVCNAVTIMLSDLLRCEVGCNQGHICKNIHFDTPSFILPTVLRDKDDPLRNFFPSQTFQLFIYCAIDLFISGLPLNGWACQPFIAERVRPEGIYSRVLFYLFLCPFISFFQRSFLLPHNCGEGTPQLWGDFTTIVGKVHHSCGAITIKGIKTTFLLKRTTFKEKKTAVVFGCFCWKWVARGNNFVEEKAAVRGCGAVASRPWGDRVLGAGRSNRGRGAMKIKEEETTFCAFRNNF